MAKSVNKKAPGSTPKSDIKSTPKKASTKTKKANGG